MKRVALIATVGAVAGTAMKRQVEIDRQTAELRGLADEVVKAESELTDRRRRLAARLRRRRDWMSARTTKAVDAHARQAALEMETRAQELAEREACFAVESDAIQSQALAVEREAARLEEVKQLVEEQARLTAEHAQSMGEAPVAKPRLTGRAASIVFTNVERLIACRYTAAVLEERIGRSVARPSQPR